VQLGYEATVDLLLRHGSNVHSQDIHGNTALYYAARHDHEGIVDRLLAGDANCAASRNAEGLNALHQAAAHNTGAILRLLLLRSADLVEECTVAGESALQLAAAHGQIQSVRQLLDFDANPLARDVVGQTCLHHIAKADACLHQDGSEEAMKVDIV
jgi:ankyrin repeat protein